MRSVPFRHPAAAGGKRRNLRASGLPGAMPDPPGLAAPVPAVVDLVNHYPDRSLFGTDEVGPTDPAKYLKVKQGNCERIFDEARRRVRAWEKKNITDIKEERR